MRDKLYTKVYLREILKYAFINRTSYHQRLSAGYKILKNAKVILLLSACEITVNKKC
ncbi:hypothetical protein [Clostridium sp.]|uniref:hypothetical protein n=1 Tax=Clostridium sp. TaxID=1506 RepID=UPI003D6D65B6